MPMLETTVLSDFARSIEASEDEARSILREIAKAIWSAIRDTDSAVDYRQRLFALVEALAAGRAAEIDRISAILPYAPADAHRYLGAAARVLIARSERDAADGLDQSAAVLAEVLRARALEPGLEGVTTVADEAAMLDDVEHGALEAVTSAGYAGKSSHQLAESPGHPDANEYRVWFGTNRQPADGGEGGFTNRRGRSVSYGFSDVYIPKSHKIGSLGSSFLTRLVTWTDDRLKLRRTCPLAADAYWSLLRAQLESVEDGRRHAVVFIHGYNVSFEDAALRAAQIGFDLGVEGAMAFFSWPSTGTVEGYPTDEATIEASEPAITDFLVDFARRSGADAVHVIAHSMGNRGLLRAVSKMVQTAQAHTDVHFANFILAAPDVDADTFGNMASAYRELADRTTLYISASDRAVDLSRWLHTYPRVGFTPPVSVFDGIDTVNVTNIDLSLLGHSYVAEERGVLADMHALIFEGTPPDGRFSLRAAHTASGKPYWIVRD